MRQVITQLVFRTLLLFFVVIAPPLASYGAITLSQAKLGNVFLTTEPVELPLTCTGNRITWAVSDYFGAKIDEGALTPQQGATIIRPNVGGPGYFDVQITELDNTTVLSRKSTAFAVLTPFTGSAAELPFGVHSHFAQYNNPDVMPLLTRAGIKHIRDEQYWNSIESPRGTFNFPSSFTNYMNAAAAQSAEPLIILDWSNRHYDYDSGDFTAPYSDFGRQGYVNYAQRLLSKYGSQIKAFEIWNEYNADTFVKGPALGNKSYNYYQLLKRTFEGVKAVRSDVKILAGGTVPIAHGFLRDIFSLGALPYCDVISVHPYRRFPDGIDLELSELRALIKAHNGGVEKPIWATEFSMGVDTDDEQYSAAAYLAQIVTLMLSERVERMYYYLTMDDSLFQRRGLVSSESDPKGKYTPHPVYVAYATLIRQLASVPFQTRVEDTSPSTYIYRFGTGENSVHVLWAVKPLTIYIGGRSALSVTNLMGNEATLAPVDGIITLTASPDVQYIRGSIDWISEGFNNLLAESVSGYSKVQGQHGWQYGYANLGSTAPYAPDNFQPMAWRIWTGYNYRWIGNGDYPFVSNDQMHPSNAWSIRRWICTVPGAVTLSGTAARSSGGDGVNLRIFLEGTEVLTKHVGPDEVVNYSVPDIWVDPGTRIDFTLNQGGDFAFDSTTFTAAVTLQDNQPATYLLAVAAGTGSGRYPETRSITITANPAPAGQQFTGWTGDVSAVSNASSPTTTVTMPARPVNLTATYTPIPDGVPGKIRYFPRYSFQSRMVGGIFEATNGDPITGPYTRLHTITAVPPLAWTEVSLMIGNYRYFRYRAPDGAGGNVAELEFFRDGVKLAGTPFGTPGSYQNQGNTFHKALDGNTNSYFDAPTASSAFVGLDTGNGSPALATYPLTVNSGSGSGNYAAGATVTVTAAAPSAGQQFSRWTGDAGGIANAAAATTTLTMPSAAVSITATYAPISSGTPGKIRYFPRASFMSRMVGGVFEGTSGDAVSGPYTPIHTITTVPPLAWTEVSASLGNYRYLRYRAPDGAGGNIAELEFYRDGVKVVGTPFGTPGSYENRGATFHKAVDGQTITYFDAPTPASAFVGIDTGASNSGPVTHALIVNAGTGGGNYPSGSTVTVVANPPATGQQFTGWTGDIGTLSNPNSATTTLTMPGNAVSITATYSPVPAPVADKVRYYPRGFFLARMVGGVFEGTDGDPMTGPYTPLHTITTAPQLAWTEVNVNLGTFRYLRYRAPDGAGGNVAEIEFYRNGVKVNGVPFGTPGSYQNQGNTFQKALDGNTGTYFDAPTASSAFVGIDTAP
jgi:uncharacterized repeat protein (TIGR02543 family)